MLTDITKMAKDRTEAIRTTVLNHSDATILDGLTDEEIASLDLKRDKDGHYVPLESTEVRGAPSDPTKFNVVVTKGSAGLNVEALKAMAKDPEDDRITWQEFLSMTEPVRVFDNAKAIIAARKNPELLKAVAACTTTGQPSLQVRQPKA